MLLAMLEQDRKQAGWSVVQAAWRLRLSVPEYRELEARRSLTDLRDVGPDLQAVRLATNLLTRLDRGVPGGRFGQ
jgi:hypothetical protein